MWLTWLVHAHQILAGTGRRMLLQRQVRHWNQCGSGMGVKDRPAVPDVPQQSQPTLEVLQQTLSQAAAGNLTGPGLALPRLHQDP